MIDAALRSRFSKCRYWHSILVDNGVFLRTPMQCRFHSRSLSLEGSNLNELEKMWKMVPKKYKNIKNICFIKNKFKFLNRPEKFSILKLKNFHKIRKITLYLKIRNMNNIFPKQIKNPPCERWRGIRLWVRINAWHVSEICLACI